MKNRLHQRNPRPKLKLRSIKFGEPGNYHFISFNYEKNNKTKDEDKYLIHIEVNIPASVESNQIEKIARDKASTFIKQLAASF